MSDVWQAMMQWLLLAVEEISLTILSQEYENERIILSTEISKNYQKEGLRCRSPWINSVLLLRIECSCALSGHLVAKGVQHKNPVLRSFLACTCYPCVCPFGALTYLLRKNILLIGLVGAFHALFTAPTGLKHGYPRSSDDRSADRG